MLAKGVDCFGGGEVAALVLTVAWGSEGEGAEWGGGGLRVQGAESGGCECAVAVRGGCACGRGAGSRRGGRVRGVGRAGLLGELAAGLRRAGG